MKRHISVSWLAVFVAGMLLLSLAACGGTAGTGATAAATATTAAATTAAAADTPADAPAEEATTAATTAAAAKTTAATQAATAAADETKENVDIEFWHIWAEGNSATHMTQMLEQFASENPNIKTTELGVTFWDYGDKLNPALAAGTGPDLMMGDLGNPKARAKNGQIMNLQPYINSSRMDVGLFFPATVEQCMFQGEMYALPFITDTRVLYWNKAHFTEAGLDPETPPTTWDQVIDFNSKLTRVNDGGEVERMGFSTRIGNFYSWTLAWTYGAELFNADFSPNMASPEMLAALNTALTIQNQVGLSAFDGYNESSKALGFSPFVAETLSMVVETNAFYNTIREYNPEMSFGVALLPTVDGVSNKSSWGNGFSLEIAYKNDARAQATFDLAAFLTRTDVATSFIVNCSDYVCNSASYEDPAVKSDPIWQILAESGRYTKFRNFIEEYPTWYGSLEPEWEAALMGLKEPREALEEANNLIVQEMENYRMMN